MTKNQKMNRDLSFDIRSLDDEKRTFELSFSSEEPYQRWFGPEVLSHEPGAIDLSRLNEIGVLLYNHNRDKVIGRIDKAWTKDNRAYAQVTFDEDDESDVIYQKVKSQTLKAVSVGYQVESWEEVAAGKTSVNGRHVGPCSVALKWQPYEISIVSVPADATVGVGREMENELETLEKADYSYYERQIQLTKNLLGVK
ncbi:HK97 family phage prohead protease [Lysinibacillus pakistanensis]|uniref:HK97 family phage prohead protease n=1 Tax=Lysinibacillus pakistanensis TaxID=759811 RepID=UPI003D2A6A4D